jgi:hypothetical protein
MVLKFKENNMCHELNEGQCECNTCDCDTVEKIDEEIKKIDKEIEELNND